jgi:nucleotide-binding universal stress UspA family protein
MYRRILIAVNEHLNSEVMARYAIEFAREAKAKLYLCYIAEKDTPEDLREHAEKVVKRLASHAKTLNVDALTITASGDPVSKIKEAVHNEKIDLVFAASRRKDIQRRFFIGTVARRLSLELPCSTALMRVVHLGRVRPKEILVPIKARISHLAERAFFCAAMARAFGSRIFLFHAIKPISKFFSGELAPRSVEWEQFITEDIGRFIQALNTYEVKHEKKMFHGAAGPGITIAAATKRTDLIIMGASKRGFLYSFFKGNPVENVLRRTPCNLIILNPRITVRSTG